MRAVAALTVLSVILVGCAGSDDVAGSTTTTTVAPSTTTSTPTTTSSTTTTIAPPTTTTIAETTTTVDSRLIGERIPPADVLAQEMWAVYVFVWENVWDVEQFVASGGQESLDTVKSVADALGYDPDKMTLGDLSCDPGGHELLGLDKNGTNFQALALYFTVESDAQEVAAAFEPHTVGYGLVQIGCAD
jgi:hypothetical protein